MKTTAESESSSSSAVNLLFPSLTARLRSLPASLSLLPPSVHFSVFASGAAAPVALRPPDASLRLLDKWRQREPRGSSAI